MRDYFLPSKANPVKILIVDDDANVRSILAQHLSHENCACITSENAFDALNKIKHTDFSLVISDVMMPDMDGFEVCRSLRADPTTGDVQLRLWPVGPQRARRPRGADAACAGRRRCDP